MQRRHLLLLGGAAAASVAAALLLTPQKVEHATLPNGGLAFPGLADRLQGAARIEVRKPDATLVLQRQGEAWVLPEKSGYPARPEKVREALMGLTELRLVEPRTSDPAQLERLGLDDPAKPGSTALLLRVLDGAGAPLVELVVGRRRVRTQGNLPESVYVRRPNETQSWLAEGRLALDADPQLWIDRDIANFPAERVRSLAVTRPGEAPLRLAREDAPDAKLRLAEPAGQATDEVAVEEVARAFEYLTFLDVMKAAEMPGEALGEGRFGLSEGLAVTVTAAKRGEDVWVRLVAEGGEAAAGLNARWQGWAYQVGSWKEKAFVPRLADLLPRPAEPAAGAAPAAAPPAAGGPTAPAPAPAAPGATPPAVTPPATPAAPPQ
ncbi:DUF4340 domain-containing protein [Siccirubricoccus phaeus]|uniref:DUF4340 domain-containing protein n=1 Tax=Siccirubricoccus phaeus TaxID=2595053 RepID=UPI0011F0F8E9|nr:DUF4340 domain-containing protein [Siccirubricoccus phaeus]